jgi:hypothetical protein
VQRGWGDGAGKGKRKVTVRADEEERSSSPEQATTPPRGNERARSDPGIMTRDDRRGLPLPGLLSPGSLHKRRIEELGPLDESQPSIRRRIEGGSSSSMGPGAEVKVAINLGGLRTVVRELSQVAAEQDVTGDMRTRLLTVVDVLLGSIGGVA